MKFLRAIYTTVVDALFPVSEEEEFLRSLGPEDAEKVLPVAPKYDASVVPLPGARSVLAYKDERVSRLVWCIKNKKDAHAVRIGGFLLWHALQNVPQAVLVPIPITKRRRRDRGYNQCELLIDEVVRLDEEKRFMCEKNLLIRTKNSSAQKTKSREERLEDVTGIFTVNPGTVVPKNTHIVVIDDVITTGSTVRAAIDILRAEGFSNVDGLSLAH